MLDAIQGLVTVHETAIVVIALIVAAGAGIFFYGRYHERRTATMVRD